MRLPKGITTSESWGVADPDGNLVITTRPLRTRKEARELMQAFDPLGLSRRRVVRVLTITVIKEA